MDQITSKSVRGWAFKSAGFFMRPLGLALVLGLIVQNPLQAAGEPLEYRIKAAYLLNFTKFIDWPDSAFARANSPITICVAGEDPFNGVLEETIAGESVDGRPVAVQRIGRALGTKTCQIVFSRSGENLIKGPGILTVGEGPAFLKAGGMIAFVIDNRRVRFDVNQMLAEANGPVAPKLLQSRGVS